MEPTVCIIDDDLVSQFATIYSIEQVSLSSRIVTCDSAKQALELFSNRINAKEALPDILFLDLVMPKMDGWEFLEKLKQMDGEWQKIDIYVLSSFVNSKDREKVKHHPMIQGYFDKPLSKGVIEKIFTPKLH